MSKTTNQTWAANGGVMIPGLYWATQMGRKSDFNH